MEVRIYIYILYVHNIFNIYICDVFNCIVSSVCSS